MIVRPTEIPTKIDLFAKYHLVKAAFAETAETLEVDYSIKLRVLWKVDIPEEDRESFLELVGERFDQLAKGEL